jgi:hypothetical protein
MTDSIKTHKEYAIDFLEANKVDLANRINISNSPAMYKLTQLFFAREDVRKVLYPSEPGFQTKIKTNLITAFQNNRVDKYVSEGSAKEDLKADIDDFKTNSAKFLTITKSPKKHLKENIKYYPFEIAEAIKIQGISKMEGLEPECVCGIVYGMILVENEILGQIEEMIFNSRLPIEILEEIEARFGDKIQWNDKIPSLARLINMLYVANIININPASTFDRGTVAFKHFRVLNSSGKEASHTSFKKPFGDTLQESKLNSDKLKVLLEVI